MELMVGILAASILAITIGAMLYYSYSGLRKMRALAEMERDGSLAMRTMSRVIRGASSNNIRNVSSSSVIVSNVNGITAQSFTLSSGKLVYTGGMGGAMDLAQTDVAVFNCTPVSTNNQVRVVLTLTNTAYVTMSMTNIITLRN